MSAVVVVSGVATAAVLAAMTGLQGPPGPAVAAGAAGQFYVTNAAATSGVWATMSGDASADTVTVGKLTVTGLQGRAISAAAPNAGNTLGWTGAAWAPSALNLAGGANYVTGVLPAANQASQAMAGDVTGTTAAAVVAKANGATIPAAGALTVGNVLQVSGVSALSYGPVNLAGGANYVTGVLPSANVGNPAGEVTGTQAATVVSGPFATAALLWKNTVAAAALGTNVAAATLSLQADLAQTVMQLAGGTQNGVALGAAVASAGHVRFATGVQIMVRNPANTGNNSLVYDDAGGSLYLGQNGYTTLIVGGASATSASMMIGGTIEFSVTASSVLLGTHFSEQYVFDLNNTAKLHFQNVCTSASIVYDASASAAGNTFTITGQGAGGAGNDGGAVSIGGGAHAGANAVDGSVKITTPLNPGFVSVAAAAPTNLTNGQSDANVLILTGAIGGPFTVNVLRRIADTSLMVIRNTTGVVATIAYLTGGTITIAAGTSAVICSDGANLQKVVIGT